MKKKLREYVTWGMLFWLLVITIAVIVGAIFIPPNNAMLGF